MLIWNSRLYIYAWIYVPVSVFTFTSAMVLLEVPICLVVYMNGGGIMIYK